MFQIHQVSLRSLRRVGSQKKCPKHENKSLTQFLREIAAATRKRTSNLFHCHTATDWNAEFEWAWTPAPPPPTLRGRSLSLVRSSQPADLFLQSLLLSRFKESPSIRAGLRNCALQRAQLKEDSEIRTPSRTLMADRRGWVGQPGRVSHPGSPPGIERGRQRAIVGLR